MRQEAEQKVKVEKKTAAARKEAARKGQAYPWPLRRALPKETKCLSKQTDTTMSVLRVVAYFLNDYFYFPNLLNGGLGIFYLNNTITNKAWRY